MIRPGPIVLFLLICCRLGYCQLVVVPLPKSSPAKTPFRQARIQSDTLLPMPLPFWDDFSFSDTIGYPSDTLWRYGRTVLLNDGIPIKPPSIGVVTFDGLDSLGVPYDVANPLAKGFADRLISRAIRLDLVPASQIDSVYLSFYYQFEGNGEAPDPGDQLTLDFLSKQGEWINEFEVTYDTALHSDTFYSAVIKIDSSFFYNDFQFRFRNYGRLSGPYDTWNLDYVYVNAHRNATDTSFPDRTVTRELTSMLGVYTSIPLKHFITNPVVSKPSLGLHNMEYIPGNTTQLDVQPINYNSSDSIIQYTGSAGTTTVHALDSHQNIGTPLQPLEYRDVAVNAVPDLTAIDSTADSVQVYFKVKINSGDNVFPIDTGDYDPKYIPIDFRLNDRVQSQTWLSNYYAYDDGTAEYGIGLNQPSSQVAYLFQMQTPKPDTIRGVYFYFPHFGDESSQVIRLRILRDLSDAESSILYEENITINRSELNRFTRHNIESRSIGVQGSFYIGWAQSSATPIPIGWDKNTDSGSNIWYNTDGAWVQNIDQHGSMMLRPIFGEGEIPLGLADEIRLDAFPNPGPGSFYLLGTVEQLQLIDMAGRPVNFTKEVVEGQTHITLAAPHAGIYILRLFYGGRWSAQKVMVRP